MAALNVMTYRYIDNGCKKTENNATVYNAATCGSQFTDPDGNVYVWNYQLLNNADVTITDSELNHTIYFKAKAKCGDEGVAKVASGARQFAIFYIMEGGSIYCVDNE